jgi:hypothetical protein
MHLPFSHPIYIRSILMVSSQAFLGHSSTPPRICCPSLFCMHSHKFRSRKTWDKFTENLSGGQRRHGWSKKQYVYFREWLCLYYQGRSVDLWLNHDLTYRPRFCRIYSTAQNSSLTFMLTQILRRGRDRPKWYKVLCFGIKRRVFCWTCSPCSMFNGLHGTVSQEIELFITTAVRTSDPIRRYILDDIPLHIHRCENLSSYTAFYPKRYISS